MCLVKVANDVLKMYTNELTWKLSQVDLITACPQIVTTAAMHLVAAFEKSSFMKNDELFGLLHPDVQASYPNEIVETYEKQVRNMLKTMQDVVSTREQADFVLSTWLHQPNLEESTVTELDEFINLDIQ